MVPHRVLEPNERAIVHEGRLQGDVAQWRGAKGIAVRRVTRDLFEPEVLVRARSVELHVADGRHHLRHADHVLAEVTEHLVRLPRDLVAPDAPSRPEEEHGAAFLGVTERVRLPTSIPVDRRVRVDLRELELGERLPDVLEADGRPVANVGEHLREQSAVVGRRAEPPEHLGADGVVVAVECEARPVKPKLARYA